LENAEGMFGSGAVRLFSLRYAATLLIICVDAAFPSQSVVGVGTMSIGCSRYSFSSSCSIMVTTRFSVAVVHDCPPILHC
jgi:hypothetical protein